MIVTLQTLVFFRETFIKSLDRMVRPYYTHLLSSFRKTGEESDDEDGDDQVFSEFDDERGVVFYPPVYLQRYAAVTDCLMDEQWCGKLEKVVDLGYHDMSFIKYLKEIQGIKYILGVDIETIPLRCSSNLIGCDDYTPKREDPLQITLFEGNAADPDFRLIGCDAVIAIEMIEHMLPHDLERLLHTVFGFIRPWIVIFTTPNGDFNVLFKALEKNGLRRMDHFFEWSREQFNDWCSNIVARYPDYTVTCKGIGPGPPGTEHLGCCSQMALFVSKNYTKQPDLNLNSLSLVSDVKNSCTASDITIPLEPSIDWPLENNMIYPLTKTDSYSGISENNSCVTIIPFTPTLSLETLSSEDKTLQCNLEMEMERSYLMFDYDQSWFRMLSPRRAMRSQSYVIEDVACRLNCTTLQAKKFSKTTQSLIERTKSDALSHTREVVDEIKHITKQLNLKSSNDSQIWRNFNWGDNAPYWNQYYKIVKDYSYPFEKKSEECRILDLISDEINRLIDMHYDEDFCVDVNKFEIPLEQLMPVVSHITDDVDQVKELLEWNGYVIIDDMVIHSRLVNENISIEAPKEDWEEIENHSDWDSTDVYSTSMSDGSTVVPDYDALCLRRALDHKVRKLRTMLIADQDVTTELDLVVCRLMKLALRTSRDRQTPLPTRWMQCKLLDLLTLTETAIERRKKYFEENACPVKAISPDPINNVNGKMMLEKLKDDTALKIVAKYAHLLESSVSDIEKKIDEDTNYNVELLKDDFSVTSTDFLKDIEYMNGERQYLNSVSQTVSTNIIPSNASDVTNKDFKTENWLKKDGVEIFSNVYDLSDTKISVKTKKTHKSCDKSKKSFLPPKNQLKINKCVAKKCHVKTKCDTNLGTSKTMLNKKLIRNKSSYNNLVRNFGKKFIPDEYALSRKSDLKATASKPIPKDLIRLCQPELVSPVNNYNEHEVINFIKDSYDATKTSNNISATEESHIIEIITDNVHETIALRRTVPDCSEFENMVIEDEMLIRSVSNTIVNEEPTKLVMTENVQAQTIFLNDINEPTTSKGVRHVSMEVQCGPDTATPFSVLSATTSLTKVPNIFSTGIKIVNSNTNMKDCCTCTEREDVFKIITPTEKQKSIVINEPIDMEAQQQPCEKVEDNFTNIKENTIGALGPDETEIETKLIKPVESLMKMDDSCSELCLSLSSLKYSTNIGSPKSIRSSILCTKFKDNKFGKLSLGCGGIQVHSFKDKQTSEDVMYQGEWQRHRPKKLTKKKIYTPVFTKKTNSSNLMKVRLGSKEKILTFRKTSVKAMESSKPLQMRNMRLKREIIKKEEIKMPAQKPPVRKPFINTAKVTSKKVPTSNVSQNIESIEENKPLPISNVVAEDDIRSKILRKNYIPAYLKRKARKVTNDNEKNVNQSLDSVKRILSKVSLSSRSKHNFQKDLLKFQRKIGDVKYLVLRNETEKKNSVDGGKKVQNVSSIPKPIKRPISPNSQNSSTCSSPNSIATVRAVKMANRSKNITNRRQSATSYKSSGTDSENTSPARIKKMPKRYKTKTSDNVVENKENIAQSSKNVDSKPINVNLENSFQTKNTVVISKLKDGSHLKPTVIPMMKSKVQKTVIEIKEKENIAQTSKNNNKENNKSFTAQSNLEKAKVKYDSSLKPTVLQIEKNKPQKKVIDKRVNYAEFSKQSDKENDNSFITQNNIGKNHIKGSSNLQPSVISITNSKDQKKVIDSKETDITSKSSNQSDNNNNDKFFITENYVVGAQMKDDFKLQPTVLSLAQSNRKTFTVNQCITENFPRSPVRSPVRTPISQRSSQNVKPQIQDASESDTPNKVFALEATMKVDADSTTTLNGSPIKSPKEKRSLIRTSVSIKSSQSLKPSTQDTLEADTPNIVFASKTLKEDDVITNNSVHGSPKKVRSLAGTPVGRLSLQSIKPSQEMINSDNSNMVVVLEAPKEFDFDPINSLNGSPNKSPTRVRSLIGTPIFKLSSQNLLSTPYAMESVTQNKVMQLEEEAPKEESSTFKSVLGSSNNSPTKVKSHNLITEWIDNSNTVVEKKPSYRIFTGMKQLIENTLDFIDDSEDVKDAKTFDETKYSNNSMETEFSAASFNTIVNDDYSALMLQNDLEQAMNRSFETTFDENSVTVTDFDSLSFKSIVSTSKFSDYMSADNISQVISQIRASSSNSMRDIFERKEQPVTQIAASALASQAFSGFTINEDPVVGDKPDPINLIDSETGSMAVAINRQIRSEELFVSGQSSDSFRSCILDDEAIVPNWLFQIISRQQSEIDDLTPPDQLMVPAEPVDEDMYDANGNIMDNVGVTAGAGDGRGIHSDLSQDSSGQGSSLSSSETSSGQESEAILTDPSALSNQNELLHNNPGHPEASIVVMEFREPNGSPPEMNSNSFSHGESPRILLQSTMSDADADVSSLDTDVASDN